MSKKRIALWYNLPSGGAKRQAHMQLRGLLARGYDVEVFRPPLKHSDYLDLSKLTKETEIPLAKTEISGGPLKLLSMIRHQERRFEAMDAHSRILNEKVQGFDLLYSLTCLDFAAPRVGRFVTILKSLSLAEPSRMLYEANPTLAISYPEHRENSLKDRLVTRNYRLLAREERLNAAAFDQLQVNSFFSREAVLKTYGLDSKVVYLGVDTDLFRWHGLPRERFIIGLGALSPLKNVEFVIRSVAAMKTKPPVPLVWVCNNSQSDYGQEMVQLAQQLGVDLVIREMVTDEELVRLLNQASAMVYAPRLEPFGLAPLEAGACGVPVVAVAEGGVRETMIDRVNALVVQPDPEEAGAALDRLFSDSNLWKAISQGALAEVEQKWTLQHCWDRLELALQELL